MADYYTFLRTRGFDRKPKPDSKYLHRFRLGGLKEYTCYISDPGQVVTRVVAEGNDYGTFSDEDWNDIERVTRWLIDGDGEITTCAGTFKKLKGAEQ